MRRAMPPAARENGQGAAVNTRLSPDTSNSAVPSQSAAILPASKASRRSRDTVSGSRRRSIAAAKAGGETSEAVRPPRPLPSCSVSPPTGVATTGTPSARACGTIPDWLAAPMHGDRVAASLRTHVPDLAEGRVELLSCTPERLRAKESEWVARCLEALGHDVIVADPNFAPMYAYRSRKVKTDRRDARALAEACVLGAYRRAHRLSDEQRHVRGRLLTREALVRTRSLHRPHPGAAAAARLARPQRRP